MKKHNVLVLVAGISMVLSCSRQIPDLPDNTTTSKPWTYWWWMGSAVDKKNIRHELMQFHEAGMGGVHIIPIYGVKGYEEQFIRFLSDEWMEMLRYTIEIADSLDMGVDMTTGTGWPFGGPWIDYSHSTRKLLRRNIKLRGGESINIKLIEQDKHEQLLWAAGVNNKGRSVLLTQMIDEEGTLKWEVPQGEWKLRILLSEPTEQRVKRAAPGGEGLVMDYFSREALELYLMEFNKAFGKQLPGIRAIYNDSYEVYGANWSKKLLEEFKQRRGYGFLSHAGLLFDTTGSDSLSRLMCDYRATVSDMLLENFTMPWAAWGHEKGYVSRNQAHGSPGNILDLYAAADIPETESFGPGEICIPYMRQSALYNFKQFYRPDPLIMKMASSASHVMGKKYTAAESCTWLDDHFKVSLSQVKPQVDQMFISGINHVIFHGMTYSPREENFPGWLFYASTNFNPQSHFWNELPLLNEYISRCQALLQGSVTDNDILLYLPAYEIWSAGNSQKLLQQFTVHGTDEWFDMIPAGTIAREMWGQGYCFDYVSDRMINQSQTRDNKIFVSDNSKYKMLVIPACQTMPYSTLEKISQLAQQGISIVFVGHLPGDVPGILNHEKRKEKFFRLANKLEHQKNVKVVKQVNEIEKIGMIRKEEIAEEGLSFIRKRGNNGNIYFISNLHSTFHNDSIVLNSKAKTVAFYDPENGKRGIVPFKIIEGNKIKIKLNLMPGKSIIINAFNKKYKGKYWQYMDYAEEAIPVKGEWTISFIDSTPEKPEKIKFQELRSWTSFEKDSMYKYYSGRAKYSLQFELSQDTDQPFLLGLGDVRETAKVTLNGKDIGTTWSLPHNLLIENGVLKKKNTLEIEVRNLSANRIIYMDKLNIPWKKFYDINMVHVNYEPFNAADMKSVESGLLGPVTLTPVLHSGIN